MKLLLLSALVWLIERSAILWSRDDRRKNKLRGRTWWLWNSHGDWMEVCLIDRWKCKGRIYGELCWWALLGVIRIWMRLSIGNWKILSLDFLNKTSVETVVFQVGHLPPLILIRSPAKQNCLLWLRGKQFPAKIPSSNRKSNIFKNLFLGDDNL